MNAILGIDKYTTKYFFFFFTFIIVKIVFLGLAHCYPTGSLILSVLKNILKSEIQ